MCRMLISRWGPLGKDKGAELDEPAPLEKCRSSARVGVIARVNPSERDLEVPAIGERFRGYFDREPAIRISLKEPNVLDLVAQSIRGRSKAETQHLLFAQRRLGTGIGMDPSPDQETSTVAGCESRPDTAVREKRANLRTLGRVIDTSSFVDEFE